MIHNLKERKMSTKNKTVFISEIPETAVQVWLNAIVKHIQQPFPYKNRLVFENYSLCKFKPKNMYFAGSTLCLDIVDNEGNVEVVTINQSSETFGLFSGGARKLLSIKSMKSLEAICHISKMNTKLKYTKQIRPDFKSEVRDFITGFKPNNVTIREY